MPARSNTLLREMTEHARDPYVLRERRPREIPWGELRPRDLSHPQARVLGEEWRARMIQEHLAVGAFSELALELANTGCETVVLELVTRAASDEVRHREV